jgi:uncharacterized protein
MSELEQIAWLPHPTTRPAGEKTLLTPAWSPPSFHVLSKPTGAICNLACSYCFFLDKEVMYEDSRFHMSDEVLDRYIRQLVDAHATPQVTVAWQGGEPTLMGLHFYRRAIELQGQYRKPGMTFLNTMQTNGTLLTDEWCEFFKENDYLIGISIDGPQHLHDAYRVNKKGKGSFNKVMRGLRILQKHDVEYNILTTVNRVNGDHPLEVYRFLRDEARTDWMQFIPVIERVDEHGQPDHLRGMYASERSVQPEQFGRFLIAAYDEWVRHDVGSVFVQTFEASARNWMGLESSGMCVFNETCGLGVALEHTGDLYSCDHFVDDEFLLGNIAETDMGELVASEQQHQFGQDKHDGLPQYCLDCDVRFACHGECPKNRFLVTPDGQPGLNYLCAGFKEFFHHIDHPMKTIAATMRSGRPASDVMDIIRLADAERTAALRAAGRNGPCPCGSGRKTKQCHGRPAIPKHTTNPLQAGVGIPRPRIGKRAKHI